MTSGTELKNLRLGKSVSRFAQARAMSVCPSRVQEIETNPRLRRAMIARYLDALESIVAIRKEKFAQMGGAR
jgi:hypothetical protein